MTEEEFFIKNYPDSCYGDKPLSPHWDYFQDGVEFGERQSEKKIEELEKKNAELQEINTHTLSQLNLDNGELITELTKAKEIIHKVCYEYGIYDKKLMEEAKQFLKDQEEEPCGQ